ncbi:MAG TPA: LysM peptidoglycan-binding domain-containing protein [Anaerolineales bacterium]|nr:LysM peptidoglycan-binding domain-containing protein [Anaerolineales bacterium]
MRRHKFAFLLVFCALAGLLLPAAHARADSPIRPFAYSPILQSSAVTSSDLILAMNTLRVSNGLQALIVDPVVMSVAQATADTMAAYEMSWHIGDVRGRIAAAGYGNGATVWATENFAVGLGGWGIDQIMLSWADPDHMRPATNPAYCHVGAGVSTAASGRIYYVLQAAYVSGNACGPYEYTGDTGGGSTGPPPVSQVIIPVQVATPDADGKIYHEVKSGQSFWSIAVAYKVTIADIEFWNNLSRDLTLKVGTRLFIPSSSTQGYATPTPVGLVAPAKPDENGRIVHVVEPFHTLITISAAYKVELNTILALNGWSVDWPLSVGQELLISPGAMTDTPTPLSPLARLTPAADGKYYHTVASGETISYIAGLYGVAPAQLMSWNGLGADTIIYPGQQLLLQVTPPAPPTSTPGSPIATSTLAPTDAPSPSPPPTRLEASPTRTPEPAAAGAGVPDGLVYGAVLAAAGLFLLIGVFVRRRPSHDEG